MFKLFFNKSTKIHGKERYFIFLLAFAALLFSTCDEPMGMGDFVDLEPPILYVTSVELPDGTIKEILDENGKIFIGPGIMFGKGALLKGKAWDNIGVEQIQVVETETNLTWTSTNVTSKSADPEGWQEWSISLEGLQNGERNIEITAYDHASSVSPQKNIGPDTVKQLTLLVDTEPPIVESIKIERHPGVFAELLPRNVFDTLDQNKFEYIDYFQNEKFTLRASISHEFNLSKVTLNFLDEDGKPVFAAPRQSSGTVFTPYWDITADDLIAVKPAYSTGKHYLKVVITATAEAGHSGSNVIQNQLFNLCWYPESDYPHIVIDKTGRDTDDTIHRVKSSVFPINVFDDDKIDEAYYAIVSDDFWKSYRSGETDEQKMTYIRGNKDSFKDEANNYPLKTNQLTATSSRNEVVPVQVGPNAGEYRLIILAKENKTSGSVMSHKLYTLKATGEDDSSCNLVTIVCESPDGAYPKDSVLKFKMIFSAEVYTVDNVSITIQGGAGGNQGEPVTINVPTVPDASADFALTGSWTVPENIIFDPVKITAINISNVRRWLYDTIPDDIKNDSVINQYNSSRTGLKVMSVKPYITKINNKDVSNNETVLASSGGKSQLTLTFSHPVFPENGTITIRPASGWLIPPVLTNDDFAKINNAVSSTEQTTLTSSNGYIKTTHGLKTESRAGTIYYVPDTETKYVLNFSSGLDNAGLRTILEKAKYNWQEIDISGSQVTGKGTDTITVDLDELPNGRLWKVEIVGPKTNDGAFRDEAGNTFAGWGTGSTHTFWSAKTAEPVIRVNRVSNNRAISSSAGTLQTGVQYRIDCETPGATIQYGDTRANVFDNSNINTQRGIDKKVAIIVPGMTSTSVYKANSDDGNQNSEIPDATSAEMTAITLNAYTGTQTIDDGNYYTARKDYIAATAKRNITPSLDTSGSAYEGAFKTVVVYRGVDGQVSTGRFLKIEGSNLRNGAVTISGFPINMNDMSGNSSKFAYRNGSANTADWIWITWEIVSEFWQVSPLSLTSNQPGAFFNYGDNDNSWQPFSANYYVHNYRKYGNWGMQIGNN